MMIIFTQYQKNRKLSEDNKQMIIPMTRKKHNDSNHLLLAAAAGARCAPGWPCPAACSSGMFAAAVTAFMTMRPSGMMYIHCKTTSQVEGGGRNI
jgi:hypothetical protein